MVQSAPTREGFVAFSAMPAGSLIPNIYVVLASGTGRERLLIPNASWPAVSTDGSILAFVRGQNIYLANYDGSGIRAITNHAATVQVAHPAFNAVGNVVIFAMGSPTTPFAVVAVNIDGSGETTITPNGLDPTFTPDGTQIVFALANTIDILPVNHLGDNLQPSAIVTQVPSVFLRYPVFSPRTQFSAYTFAPSLTAVPSIRLISFANGQRNDSKWEVNATQPAFSPDGKRIAFTRDGDIYVKSVVGGAPIRLTSGRVNSEPVWMK